MRALVTGANGFIGSNLVEGLLAQGATVSCLIRRDSTEGYLKGLDIRKYQVDYTDVETLLKCDGIENVEYVFHLAGITQGVTIRDFLRANVMPTKNLLEALKTKGVRLERFILLSSQAASGPAKSLNSPKTTEDYSIPIEYYGVSKLEAEKIVKGYSHLFPITIIRPPAVYGPRDKDFLNLYKQINSGLSIFWGNRYNYISIIFVTDLIMGILKAATNNIAIGKTYFLCDDHPVSWQDIVNILGSILGKRNRYAINIPSFVADMLGGIGDVYSLLTKKQSLLNRQKVKLSKPKFWVCSNEQARKEINFTPQFTIEEGLKITFEWYKQNSLI